MVFRYNFGVLQVSKISLVDLAGSERQSSETLNQSQMDRLTEVGGGGGGGGDDDDDDDDDDFYNSLPLPPPSRAHTLDRAATSTRRSVPSPTAYSLCTRPLPSLALSLQPISSSNLTGFAATG